MIEKSADSASKQLRSLLSVAKQRATPHPPLTTRTQLNIPRRQSSLINGGQLLMTDGVVYVGLLNRFRAGILGSRSSVLINCNFYETVQPTCQWRYYNLIDLRCGVYNGASDVIATKVLRHRCEF